VAWRQLEPKVETILAKEDGGFDLIQAELDATFRYNEDVEMPRAFERFFYGLNRKPAKTLLAYVADHREALHEVEKHPRKRTWEDKRKAFLPTVQPSSEGISCIEGQCKSMSTMWTSWPLGCQLHSLSNKDEPFTIDYVITYEEGQDGLCHDGPRPCQTCSCRTSTAEL